ncbi:MAG: hypothetical protein ACRDZO_19610 [Egibacteraceae bacterium]
MRGREHEGKDLGVGGEVGRAVVTSAHLLCWTPCHRQPIRLRRPDQDPGGTMAATCPRCGMLWTVELRDGPCGSRPHVIWRALLG